MVLHKLLDLTDVQRQQIRFSCKDQVLPGNPAIFDVFVEFAFTVPVTIKFTLW